MRTSDQAVSEVGNIVASNLKVSDLDWLRCAGGLLVETTAWNGENTT